MLRISTLLTLGLLVVSAGSASAQSSVEIGGPTTSFILGSVTDVGCVFRRSNGQTFRYRGVIRRLGVDIGIYQSQAIEWAVYAPTYRTGPADLSGNYGGVSGSVSVGVGLGGNILVGGSNNSYALQPVSVQGQSGLSVAAGVAGLSLYGEGKARRKARRHR
jgi:Protein of unknown function (DUF992)